ncbi:MAG: NUDIX hydrolase [Myxococcota bacterium]
MKPSVFAKGAYTIIREVARHVLRRPVVGVAVVGRTRDNRYLLIRRGDSGQWALPGGTLEWGETLRTTIVRELAEEAGVDSLEIGRLVGVYSEPSRDPRFHAVTVVVEAIIEAPTRAQLNPLEILEVRLFQREELPAELSHHMTPMLRDALAGETRIE